MRVPLEPPPGIVSDDTAYSVTGRWADGSNVRFWRGKPQVIGGWSSAFPDALTGVCRNVLAWNDNQAYPNVAFGTHSALMIYKSGALADITPAGLAAGAVDGAGAPGYSAGGYGAGGYGGVASSAYFPRTWSLDNWGEQLIANPRGGGIYIWANDTTAAATIIATAPAEVNCILVTPQRQVLALGCNEELSGTYNPMCIRGSDIEDNTDWTTTAANNAFEHILEGSGRIVGARMIGPYVAVWTDNSCYLGQFIGDAGQTFRFELINRNCGLAGPNAVTVLNQTAYWITPDFQVYAWQVGSPPQMLVCPIREGFAANVSDGQADKIVASTVGQYGEVWFWYPDARDGVENSRYIAMSTVDGAWFRGQLSRTASIDAGSTAWPLAVTAEGNVYWHELGQSADGGTLSWFIETADQYIDQSQGRMMLRGIWPDFQSQVGTVSLDLILRAYPQASERAKGPYTLAANANRKDFLADGRTIAARFSGESAPAFVRFGKPTFDVVPTGQQ